MLTDSTTTTEGTTTMFNVNDHVTLLGTDTLTGWRGLTGWAGLTARVTTSSSDSSAMGASTYITLDEGQKRPDGSTAMSFFWPTASLRLIEPGASGSTKATTLQQQVEDLKARITTVERLWNEDRERIGEELRVAAIRQDWCSEYEEQMERLNARLNRDVLGWQRQREYEVEVRVVRTYLTTVSVTATDAEEARGYVENGDVEWSVEDAEEEEAEVIGVEEA